jgi:hypothetical protein
MKNTRAKEEITAIGTPEKFLIVLPAKYYTTPLDVSIANSAAVGDHDNTSAFNTTLQAYSISDILSAEIKAALPNIETQGIVSYGFLCNHKMAMAETTGKVIATFSALVGPRDALHITWPTDRGDWDMIEQYIALQPVAFTDVSTSYGWVLFMNGASQLINLSKVESWPRLHYRFDTDVQTAFDASGDEHVYGQVYQRLIVGKGYTKEEIAKLFSARGQFA